MAMLSAKVAQDRIEIIRFSWSFINLKLQKSIIDHLVLNASRSCQVLEFSFLGNNVNADLLLEMCARICSTTLGLRELSLDGAWASAEQLEAIFNALLSNK